MMREGLGGARQVPVAEALLCFTTISCNLSSTQLLFAQTEMAPIAKRRKVEQVEEITFDSTARQEYLTGFHKRKLQRIENARETAAKQVKEERVRERRQVRLAYARCAGFVC